MRDESEDGQRAMQKVFGREEEKRADTLRAGSAVSPWNLEKTNAETRDDGGGWKRESGAVSNEAKQKTRHKNKAVNFSG